MQVDAPTIIGDEFTDTIDISKVDVKGATISSADVGTNLKDHIYHRTDDPGVWIISCYDEIANKVIMVKIQILAINNTRIGVKVLLAGSKNVSSRFDHRAENVELFWGDRVVELVSESGTSNGYGVTNILTDISKLELSKSMSYRIEKTEISNNVAHGCGVGDCC